RRPPRPTVVFITNRAAFFTAGSGRPCRRLLSTAAGVRRLSEKFAMPSATGAGRKGFGSGFPPPKTARSSARLVSCTARFCVSWGSLNSVPGCCVAQPASSSAAVAVKPAARPRPELGNGFLNILFLSSREIAGRATPTGTRLKSPARPRQGLHWAYVGIGGKSAGAGDRDEARHI